MNIRDIPETHAEFATLLDAYERAHLAFSPGGRAVSDATLRLLASFYPRPLRPLVRQGALALLDEPLRDAFRCRAPHPLARALTVGGLRLRAAIERRLPARRDPRYGHEWREFNVYPDGYDVAELGTFPTRAPAPAAPRSRD